MMLCNLRSAITCSVKTLVDQFVLTLTRLLSCTNFHLIELDCYTYTFASSLITLPGVAAHVRDWPKRTD